MAKVRITIEADQQMNRLPLVIRLRVVEVLARLAKWPMVSGAKPLQREWKGHFRIRVGDWRVVVRPHGEEIWIVRIDNRRDVYER